MGQLIKMQDYISRYEQNIFHYPTQYVRLKKQQWSKLHQAYLDGTIQETFRLQNEVTKNEWLIEDEKVGVFGKLKKMFSRTEDEEKIEEIDIEKKDGDENDLVDSEWNMVIPSSPKNLEELKVSFLNQLLRFQMKWASSTIRERSYVDGRYIWDEKLKFFLQRFPDNFLLLYHPVFLIKNAPVEAEVILMSPTDAWCISFLEEEDDAVFHGLSNDKFWTKKHHLYQDKKLLSPLLSLNRMEKIVSKIFSLYDVSFPVKKVVLSRNGYIDFPDAPYDLQILDKRGFPEWFEKMRNHSSPLKHQQLKGAEALLEYCQTTSVLRLEWEEERNDANGIE
ncbi:NERD domain-containing protein [Peribacillus alkalitolerans]|uniref:NERD domain-containing protein n=1 Tax=Peribacillus alkalitolerans TaxID=1550385 RepID=UPI0013CFD749|nr:NERD domain-containing protein [Peribacillus alkalitolerans]